MARIRWAAVLAAAALTLTACTGGGTPAPAPAPGATADAGGAAQGKPVTLRFVTAFPKDVKNNDGFWLFTERLKKNAPWITIDYRGGPEVMAPNLLAEGVANGSIDGANLPGDYYVEQLPIMEIARFTPFTPSEERENGVADLYDAAHEKLGVKYLGHTSGGMPQVLMLKDKVDTPDLTGKNVRVSPAMSSIVSALGGTPVSLPGGEIFTALERGTVQGTTWASVGPSDFGFHEQVKYDVSPRVYESLTNLIINRDTWDGLEPQTQKAIEDTMKEIEPEAFELFKKASSDETKVWRDAGVQLLEFTGADAEKILKIAYVDAWDALDWNKIKTATPQAEDIRKKFTEHYAADFSNAVPGGTVVEPSK